MNVGVEDVIDQHWSFVSCIMQKSGCKELNKRCWESFYTSLKKNPLSERCSAQFYDHYKSFAARVQQKRRLKVRLYLDVGQAYERCSYKFFSQSDM